MNNNNHDNLPTGEEPKDNNVTLTLDATSLIRCTITAPVQWINNAIKMVFAEPLQWISAIALLMFILIFSSLLPVVGQLLLMATSYVWFAGFLLGCQHQTAGGRFQSLWVFRGFTHKRLSSLIIFSVIIGLINSSILMHYLGDFYQELIPFADDQQQLQNYLNENIERFSGPLFSAFLTILPVFIISLLVTGIVLFGEQKLSTAIVTSIRVVALNILPLVLWVSIFILAYLTMTMVLLLGALGALLLPVLMLLLVAIFIASVYQLLISVFATVEPVDHQFIV